MKYLLMLLIALSMLFTITMVVSASDVTYLYAADQPSSAPFLVPLPAVTPGPADNTIEPPQVVIGKKVWERKTTDLYGHGKHRWRLRERVTYKR